MKQVFQYFSFCLIFLVLMSCGSSKLYNKALNNDNPETGPKERLDVANQLYEDGDYYNAIRLYEVVINENIMVNDLEEVYFRYANAHYAQFDYTTASSLYNNFYQAYPDSENAETAYYFRALSSYELAEQDFRLDQSTMLQAMKELQDYLITFPNGEHTEEAKKKIEEISITNQRKELSVGQLYFKIEEYKAAISEYNRFIEDYPTSELVEEAYFEMLRARLELAKKSIESKKKERLDAVIEHYGYFMDKYSVGPFASQAKDIKIEAERELVKL